MKIAVERKLAAAIPFKALPWRKVRGWRPFGRESGQRAHADRGDDGSPFARISGVFRADSAQGIGPDRTGSRQAMGRWPVGAPSFVPPFNFHISISDQNGAAWIDDSMLSSSFRPRQINLVTRVARSRLGCAMSKQEPTLWPFRDDPHELLARLGSGRTTADYRKDQNIYEQGHVADKVFFIQEGRVKIAVMSEQGKVAVVAILEGGQFFGEGCLEDHHPRPSSAQAITDCRITSIAKSAMLAAIREQPKFARLFLNHLLTRNIRIEADVVDQLFNSCEKRLARLLLLLANYGKEGGPPIVPVTISQETLATMIGTSRSRVSHFMNRFREAGYIDYNGEIHVHQSLLNSVLQDVPTIRNNEDSPT